MAASSSTSIECETLKNIQRLSLELSRSLKRRSQFLSSPPSQPSNIPPLFLPVPDEIFSSLDTLAISFQIRKTLKDTFTRRAAELQAVYYNHYQRSCAFLSLSSSPEQHLTALRDAYETMYRQRCLPLLRARVCTVFSEVSKRQQCLQSERRPTFNSVCPRSSYHFCWVLIL